MFKLLDELRLKPASDLAILVQEAIDTHNFRRKKPPLSRTSLFYACLKRSNKVRSAVFANGFSLEAYEKAIGLWPRSPITVAAAEPVDVDVNPQIEAALRRHADEWHQHPVDALWLAGAIVIDANFEFLDHLHQAGLTMETVQASAGTLAAALVRGDEKNGDRGETPSDSMEEEPWVRAAIKPYSSLGQFPLSPPVRRAFDGALRATRQLPVPSPVVTASLLLISVLMQSAESNDGFSWLQRRTRRLPPEEFDLRIGEWMRWYRRPMPDLVGREEGFVTDAVMALLREASRIASETGRDSGIEERQLVAALLTSRVETGIPRFLNFIDSSYESLRRDFLIWLRDDPRLANDRARWLSAVGALDEEESLDDGVIRAPAEYVDDRRRLEDQLGFRRDVNAFAALICAKYVTPPLSIGIFGDWGSGKSFFMEMLYDVIAKNASDADRGKAHQYHSRVLQIRFNAWHYIEANLWASLVEQIFGEIFQYLHPVDPQDKRYREQRDDLMKQIDEITAEKMRLQREADTAKSARDHATKEMEAERARSESSAAMVHRLVATSAWENVTITQGVQDDLHAALRSAGADRVIKTASELRDTIHELASIGTRVRVFWSWLLSGRFAGLRLAILAVMLALPVLAAMRFPELRTYMSSITTYLGLTAAWLAPMVPIASRVIKQLEAARKQVEEAFAKAEEKRLNDLETARTKQADAEAKLEAAANALKVAETNLNEAQTKLADLSDDRRLVRFVQDRAASDDYRKLLGVIATIRKDFENLQKLMTLGGKLRVDRIVLYIDDLDRCPPERVEQVLQAVHLLLAFELFVVVVGVDARWVARSLRMRHPVLLEEADGDEGGLPGSSARPEDYLEKIFQIPFWIQRMNERSTAKMIDSLLAPAPVTETHPIATTAHGTNDDRFAAAMAAVSINTMQTIVVSPFSGALSSSTENEKPIDPVEITEHERAFLHTVAPLASRSPRSLKRFVNVYRLIRSSVRASDLDNFIDEQRGDFRPALVLLAIVVGVPSIAVEFLRHIGRIDAAASLDDLANTIQPNAVGGNASEDWQKLRRHLEDMASVSRAITASDLKKQIARVGRFTFEFGRF